MHFSAQIEAIDVELFTYWVQRDLHDYVRHSRDPKASKYEHGWLVQYTGTETVYIVSLDAFQTRLDKLEVTITPLFDPDLRLSGALRAWIAHRWKDAIRDASKTHEESWEELTKEMKPTWTNEEWYRQLTPTQQTWYDRLRPFKEQWEAGETTDPLLAEAWIVSEATITYWRRQFKNMELPGMGWKKQKA